MLRIRTNHMSWGRPPTTPSRFNSERLLGSRPHQTADYDWKQEYMKLSAEMQNTRSAFERRVMRERLTGAQELSKRICRTLVNIELMLKNSSKESGNFDLLSDIFDQLETNLSAVGIQPLVPVSGEKMDPRYHSTIQNYDTVPGVATSKTQTIICELLSRGYIDATGEVIIPAAVATKRCLREN